VCGAAAALFRPEAAPVWAVTALAPMTDPDIPVRERGRRLIALVALPFGAVLVASVILALKFDLARSGAHLWAPSAAPFWRGARALAEEFPYPHGREYAPFIVLWGLMAIPLVKIVRAMGVVQALLTAAGAITPPFLRIGVDRRTIAIGAVGMILPLYAILPKRLFVETRYAIPGSLLLLTLAPFGLQRLMRTTARTIRVAGWIAAALVGLGWAWDFRSVATGTGPSYAREAGLWLADNAPSNALVHTNSPQVAYYSRRAVDWNEVESLLLGSPPTLDGHEPEFVALVLPEGDGTPRRRLEADARLRLYASFTPTDGGGAFIYGSVANR